VLFILKIEGIFGRKNQTKSVERGTFLYIYSIDIDLTKHFVNFHLLKKFQIIIQKMKFT